MYRKPVLQETTLLGRLVLVIEAGCPQNVNLSFAPMKHVNSQAFTAKNNSRNSFAPNPSKPSILKAFLLFLAGNCDRRID